MTNALLRNPSTRRCHSSDKPLLPAHILYMTPCRSTIHTKRCFLQLSIDPPKFDTTPQEIRVGMDRTERIVPREGRFLNRGILKI
jgi:hypothetical protein